MSHPNKGPLKTAVDALQEIADAYVTLEMDPRYLQGIAADALVEIRRELALFGNQTKEEKAIAISED